MNQITTTYTFDEFKDLQKVQKHPFLALCHLDGSHIVPFNGYGVDPKEKEKEIETALKSPLLDDGIYLIVTKASHSKKAAQLEYPITVGTPKPIEQPMEEPTPKLAENFSPSVTSYKEVLELRVEMERLRLENESQANYIKELEETIEEFEKAEQEQGDLLNEAQPSNLEVWGEKLMTFLAPAMDKHFEIQDKKINLRMMELQSRQAQPSVQQPAANDNEQYQMNAVKYTDQKIKEFINKYKEDPEKYEHLAAIYNSSSDLDNFFNQMQNALSEDEFNNLINFINAPGS